MTPRFAIGDAVWRAAWDATEAYVTCPDCGGTGRIRGILHDDTIVSVSCQHCSRGYEPPSGHLKVYERKGRAEPGVVSGMEINGEGLEYHVACGQYTYHVKDEDLFATRDEATARADVMAVEEDRRERDRINHKKRDDRTWAWHVSYHRSEIRRAEKDLAHHTAALNVARVRSREEKKP